MKNQFLVAMVVFAATFSALAHADNCGTVIVGADALAHSTKFGVFEANGYCHSFATVSEADCRNKTGGLYHNFYPDQGANHTICEFSEPRGDQSGRGGSDGAGRASGRQKALPRGLHSKFCGLLRGWQLGSRRWNLLQQLRMRGSGNLR